MKTVSFVFLKFNRLWRLKSLIGRFVTNATEITGGSLAVSDTL
jgi:hypothetical protein